MSSPDSPHSHDITPSLSSVESLRSSLPESYQSLFDSLRREVMDFCDRHSIPTSSLNNDEALREATKHLSLSDLEHLSLVLKRLEYLVAHKKPLPHEQDPAFQEAIEYANEHYHLQEQYTSQVSLLEQVGILKDGHIEAIDGHRYPVPTLEQIALRLFERRVELAPKHDQGFTKLLLVPFGMSLGTLIATLKGFLLDYSKKHPDFELCTHKPLKFLIEDFVGGDIRINPDGSPILVYYPTSFDREDHQGKSKVQILQEQAEDPFAFPGWTIHFFQPSSLNHDNQLPIGISSIPQEGQGKKRGESVFRPDIEGGKYPADYLSLFTQARTNPDSPYSHETGLTPEDWILAFMTHLQETGKLLDEGHPSRTDSRCLLVGSFFPSLNFVPRMSWNGSFFYVSIHGSSLHLSSPNEGSRSSVKI